MVAGGVFMATSFFISGILELYINVSKINEYIPIYYECIQLLHNLQEENSLHILWQVPQYVVLVIGEIMFMVASMEFAYSQVK